MVKLFNKSVLFILKNVALKEQNSFVTSPFSVYVVLMALGFGAAGQTLKEFQDVLRMTSKSEASEIRRLQDKIQVSICKSIYSNNIYFIINCFYT